MSPAKVGSKRLTRWFYYNMPSSFSQKMDKLSCKIFGEYYRPPMPPHVAAITNPAVHFHWGKVHDQNQALIKRQSKLPDDIDPWKTINYYPPHPQIRSLMHTLRQFGLYRYVTTDLTRECQWKEFPI
jgi:hypothetical protein